MADKHGSTDHYVSLNPSAKEVRRSLRAADKVLKREIRAKLKNEVGQLVAVEAQSLARSHGLEKSGRLIRMTRPSATQTSVRVRSSAKKKSKKYPSGYNYPKRFEFEAGGRKAFLRPALNNKKEEVLARFKEVLETVAQEFAKN